jgi:phosphoglycolate phosphatase-like HAD superfamily hydrolase
LIVVKTGFGVILFDLDGTIFDIVERDAYARCKALNQLGFNVSLEDVRDRYRYGMGQMGIVEGVGVVMTEEEAKRFTELSFAYFMKQEASDLTKIHDGAYDVLSTLSRKHKLAIVTSRDSLSSTEEELERFNIRKFMSLVVTREVAARYHGVREIPLLPFQEQRKMLYECAIGLTKISPEDMLCVGDSISELVPAKNLGIETIGVLTGFSSKKDFERFSIPAIENLAQLIKILRS